MERRSCLCLGSLLMLTTLAFGKSALKSIPWQDTGRFQHVDGSGRHRNSFERLKHQRNQAKVQAASAATSVDVGNVAVIADNGSIILQPRPAKPIDLTLPTNLNFIPAGTGAFAVAFAPASLDPVTGNTLPLSDDATVEVPVPAENLMSD